MCIVNHYQVPILILLWKKIELFDGQLTKFGNIIIYVGGNDASWIKDMEPFETQYRKLISLICGKNQDCKIYLCGSCREEMQM